MLKSKNLVVTAAWQSKVCPFNGLDWVFSFFFFFLLPCQLFSLQAQSSDPGHRAPVCKRLLAADFKKDAELQKLSVVVESLRQGLLTRDFAALRSLWHPKLQLQAEGLPAKTAGLFDTLGKVQEVSVFRAWALEHSHSESTAYRSGILCADDAVLLLPHYGYEQQLAVWLQVAGSQELAQAFFTLVPEGKHWQVGFFEMQQWTHAGKDYRAWLDLARQEERLEQLLSASFAYEAVEKLLAGNRHLQFSELAQLTAKRSLLLGTQARLRRLRKLLVSVQAKEQLVAAHSLFAPQGLGLALQYEWPQHAPSAQELEAHCQNQVKKALKDASLSLMQGVQCAYQHGRTGALGRFFIGKKDLQL